jgi:hypothetical protein
MEGNMGKIIYIDWKTRLDPWGGAAEKAEKPPEKPPGKETAVYTALPGEPVPKGIPDMRPLLQRDGLILLGWDYSCYRYTAYWITSAGWIRIYQSEPVRETDLPAAAPAHLATSHEIGWGSDYAVLVAPELFERHSSHRTQWYRDLEAHIKKLQELGIASDFDYEFRSLKKQKAIKPRMEENRIGRDEKRLLEVYREMTPENKKRLLVFVRGVADRDGEEKHEQLL